MAHESMVRNLAAQAEAIWPQELPLLRRYALPDAPHLLDLGCGTGEFTWRAAEELTAARLCGIDVHEPHLEIARERCAAFGDRVRFRQGDAFALDFEDDTFDLAACRHMLQAVPEPERVLAEMKRVTRSGGWLHLVAEDYGMIHFHPTEHDIDAFFHEGPSVFAERTGSDLLNGRKVPGMLQRLGLEEIGLDYLVIDTLRVERETMRTVFRAWRDGYADGIAEHSDLDAGHVRACFETMLDCLRNPEGYAVWLLPVVRGRVG